MKMKMHLLFAATRERLAGFASRFASAWKWTAVGPRLWHLRSLTALGPGSGRRGNHVGLSSERASDEIKGFLMKWTISRRVKHPETRSWALGHAVWLSLLLSHLALTTVRGAPNVVAWGADYDGQKSVPANLTNAVAVVAGENHSLALRADGTVVAWGTETHVTNGWSSYGPATVPDGLTNVVAVSDGFVHSLALLGDGPPVVQASLRNSTVSAHGFSVSLSTYIETCGMFPSPHR